MKNIKILFAFILGVAVSGFGVYALNISARETTYDNTNSGSTATNMQEAIDDLYDKSTQGGKLINCGQVAGNAATKTISISSCYDGDLTKLNANNFILELTSYSGRFNAVTTSDMAGSHSATITKSYNSSTGVLTINNLLAGKNTIYATGYDIGINATVTVWLNPVSFR